MPTLQPVLSGAGWQPGSGATWQAPGLPQLNLADLSTLTAASSG